MDQKTKKAVQVKSNLRLYEIETVSAAELKKPDEDLDKVIAELKEKNDERSR